MIVNDIQWNSGNMIQVTINTLVTESIMGNKFQKHIIINFATL